MARRKLKVLETPQGRGQVFRQDQELSTVIYDLRVTQDIEIATESPTQKNISGTITVIEGKRNLLENFLANPNDRLILHLEDGRPFPFRASKVVGDVLQISSTSGDLTSMGF